MSSKAVIAMKDLITPMQIQQARLLVSVDKRPSYELCVAVLQTVCLGVVDSRGYCDMSAQQISDRLKGAYQRDAIQNALNALTRGRILYTHKRGTIGENGSGRASQRVVVACDTAGLIPAEWFEQVDTLSGDTDLPQSDGHSQVGNADSQVSADGLSGDTDLPTLYGINHKTPTAATAEPLGGFHKDETQSLAMSDDASATRYCINADGQRVERVVLALGSRNQSSLGKDRKLLNSIAREVVATCPSATNEQLASIADEVYKSGERFRLQRLDRIKNAATNCGVEYIHPEKEETQ